MVFKTKHNEYQTYIFKVLSTPTIKNIPYVIVYNPYLNLTQKNIVEIGFSRPINEGGTSDNKLSLFYTGGHRIKDIVKKL